MKKTTKKKPRPTTQQAVQSGLAAAFHMLEILLRAVIERFPDDKTKPGVVLSYVDGEFYGSVCRYPYGERQVAFKYRAMTAEEVVAELARFVAMPRDEARRELAEMLP